MSEIDPRLGAFTTQEFWNSHYNTPDGKAKVDARQMYYWCLPEGIDPPDYELDMITAAREAGIGPSATVVDIGCSFPKFLELWKLLNHQGRLVGVEPNIMQFDGLPYWKPLKAARKLMELENAQDIDGQGVLYLPEHGDGIKVVEGIELYQSDAGSLPFADNTIDFATAMWSLYQLNEDEILPALTHIDSKVKPDGLFGAALSGENNKPNMRELVDNFADYMSERVGYPVSSPPPLQAGCTTEKGKKLLGQVFEHVSYKHYSQELVLKDTLSLFFAFNTVLSFSDRFLDKEDQKLEPKFIQKSLLAYFADKLLPDIRRGNYFYDQTDRDLILCSQRPFEQPEGFEPYTASQVAILKS